MCCQTPVAPKAPDLVGAATAQGVANQTGARQTAVISNPNIVSPYGNQTVSYGKTAPVVDQAGYDQAMKNFSSTQDTYDENGNLQSKGASPTIEQFTTQGDIQPTVTQTLTPDAQAALTAQQKVQSGTANLGLLGLQQATDVLNKPFNYTGPDVQTSLGQPGALKYDLDMSGVARMPVNAGMTGQQAIMNRLQPQIAQDEAAMTQRLANQGITPGSEAYNNAMRTQGEQRNDLYSQAALQGLNLDMGANQQGYNQAASTAGLYNQTQNQAYNQGLGNAQFGNTAAAQYLQQQLGLYNQPLNSINALMSSSQIQNPQFQQYTGANVAAAPVFQGVQAQGQAAQDLYGQQMAARNAKVNALGQIAGTAAQAAMMSDIRLKSNIVKIGDHPLGIGIYEYDIFGKRDIGVMAQEVLKVKPEAIVIHPSGYLMVNYGAL